MFLHYTMTDSEILRTCDGCESRHLKLVADRLRMRVDQLEQIDKLVHKARATYSLAELQSIHDDIGALTRTDNT